MFCCTRVSFSNRSTCCPNDEGASDLNQSATPDRHDDLAARLRTARVQAFLRPIGNATRTSGDASQGAGDATDLDALVALAGQVYSAAVTEQTRDSYARRWREFQGWCHENNVEPLPASPDVLMMYLMHGAQMGRSVTTLRGQAAAINRVHVEAGESPPGSGPKTALFWRGLARSLPAPTHITEITALRIDALREICRVIDANAVDPVEVRDRAILALHAHAVRGPAIARLDWGDVASTPTGVVVDIKPSRPNGKARVVHVESNTETAAACPVMALELWREYTLNRFGELSGRVFWQFDVRLPLGSPLTGSGVNRLRVHRLQSLGEPSAPATVERAMSLLGGKHPIDLRDKAMLLIGFAGAMRRGEVTGMRWSDIRLRDDGLVCRLRRTKTDMEGKRQTDVGIPYGRSTLTCPVTALLAWKERVEAQFGPVDPEGWVFTTAGRRGRAEAIGHDPIIRETLTHVVRKRAQAAGLAGHWGGRSLRAGFISTAADLDIPLESIATQSRHKTLDVLAVYIRDVDPFRRNPAARVGL
jgi:integrase